MNYFLLLLLIPHILVHKFPLWADHLCWVLLTISWQCVLCRACHFKLKDLNYDSFCIEIVPYIPTTFHGDVLFELPPLIHFDGHYSWMQGMDRKHDGHAWHKIKMINVKNDINLNFQRAHCLGHLSQPYFWACDQGKGVTRLRAKRKEARESRQRHCKGAGQEEAGESHHILSGM